MWVLIILMYNTSSSQGGVSSSSVEFSSRDNCVIARERVIQNERIRDAFCTKK